MAKSVPYHYHCQRCNGHIDSDDNKKMGEQIEQHRNPCIKTFLAKPENKQYIKNYSKEFRNA